VLLALACICASVAFSAECSRAKDRAGMFLVMGVASGAWVPCTGKRGNGDRRYAGNRHPVAVAELRGFRHVVCFPGDWPGDECPASRFVN